MKISFYKLYLFSSKSEDDYIYLSQERGQLLIMALVSKSERRFALIDDYIVNTSAIERIVKEYEMVEKIENGRAVKRVKNRNLTDSEIKTQKIYDKFKGQKLLN